MLKRLARWAGFEDRQSVMVPILEARIRELEAQAAYWRGVSERILNAELLKRGVVDRPVFQASDSPESVMHGLFTAMTATELPRHD